MRTLRHILHRSILLAAVALLPACSGPFTISGRVVDQNGEPVRNVRISLTGAAANSYEFDSYAGESYMLSEDGRFSLGCGLCTAAHVLFYKEGYYPQTLDLAFYEWKSGLEVVMRRSLAPVKLIRLEGRIEAGPDFDDLVLGAEPALPHVRPVSEITAEAVIPARPYVTLRPGLADDRSIARQPYESRQLPAPLELDFSAARGGVILHDGVTATTLREGFYEMPVAPDADYPPTALLDPADGNRYFYCQIAGRYCKGFIHMPLLNDGGGRDTVTAVIEIYLSPYVGNRSLDDPTTY